MTTYLYLMHLHPLNNKEQLFLLLSENAIVLTPNNRLSEFILRHYCAHNKNKIIEKPNCMPFSILLTKAYDQLQFTHPNRAHPLLLNNFQCFHLWHQIIKSDPSITYSEGLLKSVISAWELCQQWQISLDDPSFYYTTQTKKFQKWWQLVEKQLKKKHWITEHQLIPYLLDYETNPLSQAVIWTCFDYFTPQQILLQEHLAKKGLTQYQYDLKENKAKIEVLAAKDNKEEYQQLMAWLHLKREEGNQSIGIVVPNLAQESVSLQRILADQFDPAYFNISLGQPLSDFPLIAHALCWLNLDTTYLTPHQLSLLLQSPYLGGSKEEFLARSDYMQEATLLQRQILPLKKVIEELQEYAPKLAHLLSNLIPYPQEAPIQEWIHLFQERLNILGFPGDYGLSSKNFQCFNRFVSLFDELRQLALLHSNFLQIDALEAIKNLTDHTIFQPQKTNALIQITGLLEASGCEFDSLWLMGLTDQCMPQKVQLSPFISPQLQRTLQMPHSLPERELQFAHQIVQRLQRSAHEVVFSYAQWQEDNSNLPCSLITQFPHFIPLQDSPSSTQSIDVRSLDEHFTVPLLPEESISGGTALLTNQAKCPFKAFAEHRLRAKVSLQTADGLDNKDRGQVIHKIMELLWRKLETQQKLFRLESHVLEQYIEEAVHGSLAPLQQDYPDSLPDPIQEVEATRLKRLVRTCMEWEKQRPPFTIAALEKSYVIHLAGLNFNVRVDRLDHVGNKKWVIDYKSTLPPSKPWREERPIESQLLLYALLDEEINTLLLIELKKGKISCAGFSEEKQNINGITSLKKEEKWAEYRDNWQQQLTDLAAEFQQGHCEPKPSHLTICKQCDFQNLCRFQAEE